MGRFSDPDEIFADERVLDEDYVPESLVARDDEMSSYVEVLRSVANGASPRNMFVYGAPGVGKTLATRMILDELLEDQKQFDDVSVDTVWTNCKSDTSYQVACNLVNHFRSRQRQINSTGHPRGAIHNKLWQHIDDSDHTHILFVLDEVASLDSDDDLLYQIPRARSNGNITDTRIGLIGISNDFKFRDQLSPSVEATLCDYEIHFKPYNADDLVNILSQRAEKAFRANVLSSEVIPLISAKVAQRTGSARRALKILLTSGHTARDNSDARVTESHVEAAHQKVQRELIKDELEALPTQSHVILYTVLQLSREGKTPAKRSDILDRYEQVARQIRRDPMSDRTLHRRLNQLSKQAFLNRSERNQGINGGSYFEYSFDGSQEILIDVLDSQNFSW